MRRRAALQIVVGCATCAGALAILQRFIAVSGESVPEARRDCNAASRSESAAAEPASVAPIVPPLVAQRSEEIGIAPAGGDRGDPLRVAQRFIDALFSGEIETAAKYFSCASTDPESGERYLRAYHDVVIRKCFPKVSRESLRCELTDVDLDDYRYAAVFRGERPFLLIMLHREGGSWSVVTLP